MSTPQPESKIVKKILDHLNGLDRGHARKVHQSRFQGGQPDIDACLDGLTVKIEVKVPGNEPTPRQYAVMRQWAKAGALVGWVSSVEETVELLTHLGDREWVNPQLA